ncbi:MAG TPA: GNVR domain-containing protein [Blastocatellia bacterium]|nr:GNVR domain-containing protein [Blastocatellia bacterium]
MDSLRPRNIADYIRAVRRRKLAIIVPTFIVMVASAIAIKLLPNVFESSTFIIVESQQGEGSSERDLSRRLTTVRQQVTSRTRLEEIIGKHGLYREQLAKNAPIEQVIDGMRQAIDVNVNTSGEHTTDAFSISYRAQDPETARLVTAELANGLIEENIKAMEAQASGEADVLRQRAAELSSQLRDLEQKGPWLMNLKEDAPIAPAGAGVRGGGVSLEAIRTQQMSIENLKDQQYKIQQQMSDLDRRISEQRQVVEQQKKSAPLRDNPTLGALVAKRAELQGVRDNLINQQELTDKHPRVIAVNDQIASINRAINEARQQGADQVSQTPEMRELRALESERNRLKAELEVTARAAERQMANPPRAAAPAGPVGPAPSPASRDAGAARLAQDYLGLKQTYKEVLSKLQGAELKRQTLGSEKVERFRVLDQANLPQVPLWPNRRLLFLLSTFLGLALGVGVAFLLEFRRFSTLQDVKDVEYYTRLPLLAAIPKTVSPSERKQAAMRLRLQVAVGTTLALVAIFALTKVLILSNVFALIGNK